MRHICIEYVITKQSVSNDIRKEKDDLRKFDVTKETSAVKRMRMSAEQSLDEVVHKYFPI